MDVYIHTPVFFNSEELKNGLGPILPNLKERLFFMKNRYRKKPLLIYLSDEEFELLLAKTKASKLPSVSSYIRHIIVYGLVYSVDYKDLQQYNWFLSNISNNLNQIAHKVNTENEACYNDIQEAQKLMKEVWTLQLDMLQKLPYIKL